ncbi:MAG TPA: FKBP-type peptidyl-prolyl cis-trans isomerase [Woeseiaceae bacterium]|nr:FKBP-type peptidyl-prolyl cis-trans isomerase [Woeseiaceae bacterium]
MKALQFLSAFAVLAFFAACGPRGQQAEEAAPDAVTPGDEAASTSPEAAAADQDVEAVEIEPGLTMRILEEGNGESAESGQTAVVHYTGWLYDENAADKRGRKFDSSLDRGEHFEFPLGAGAVIAGWDRGVEGMKIGEVRELTIAPELAYGERGAGGVIPPGATLVFEVELADLVAAAPAQ